MTLPDFIIIGAEKAGTTWLHDQLQNHPAIHLPAVKELHYFNRFDSNLNEIDNFTRRGPDWYGDHFQEAAPGALLGEATPMYLCDPDAPARIRSTVPDARIIISLRNPVTRAYSHYRMARAKAHIDMDLDQILASNDPRILQRGLYAQQVAYWLDTWPAERLKILFFEDLIGPDSASVLQDICGFLGVDPAVYSTHDASAGNKNEATEYKSAGFYNASVKTARALRNFGPTRKLADALKSAGVYDAIKKANRKEATKTPLPQNQRDQLIAYYRDDVARLGQMLNRPLPWPEFTVQS